MRLRGQTENERRRPGIRSWGRFGFCLMRALLAGGERSDPVGHFRARGCACLESCRAWAVSREACWVEKCTARRGVGSVARKDCASATENFGMDQLSAADPKIEEMLLHADLTAGSSFRAFSCCVNRYAPVAPKKLRHQVKVPFSPYSKNDENVRATSAASRQATGFESLPPSSC